MKQENKYGRTPRPAPPRPAPPQALAVRPSVLLSIMLADVVLDVCLSNSNNNLLVKLGREESTPTTPPFCRWLLRGVTGARGGKPHS